VYPLHCAFKRPAKQNRASSVNNGGGGPDALVPDVLVPDRHVGPDGALREDGQKLLNEK